MIVALLLIVFVGIVVVCLVTVVMTKTLQCIPGSLPDIAIPIDQTAHNLAQALSFKTIAKMYPEDFDESPFFAFHEFLKTAYPLCHAQLTLEKIGKLNLLYTWKGSNTALPGILLMAHQDVVPIEPGTEQDWSYEPFSGIIADGCIWGRGALDIKNQLISILSATELLLKENFQPMRTVYFAFGCDEEVGGIRGARVIAEELKKRSIRLAYVLDEGGAIVSDMVPGIKKPVGLIGIAEKGYLTLTLKAHDEGGHSSMPQKHTSLGKVARALVQLEAKQFKPAIRGAVKHFLRFLAPELPLLKRIILTNKWLFRPLIIALFSQSKTTNALLRTTQAGTMASASNKENVLPQKSTITINFRILPGETANSVKKHVEQVINDATISIIDPPYHLEPSKVSNPYSSSFRAIQQTLSTCFHDTVVLPYLVLGGTDSRFYEPLSQNIYRFSPVVLTREALATMHGTNEHISIASLAEMVRFFYLLIQTTSQEQSDEQ